MRGSAVQVRPLLPSIGCRALGPVSPFTHCEGPVATQSESGELRDWRDLTAEEQLQLREAYGHYLDNLPPTCDLDGKIERFRRWLAERGVRYSPEP